MYEAYLAHYGVLGMKWGIRRYQPYSVRGRKSGEGGKEVGEAKRYNSKAATDALLSRSIKGGKDKPNISPAEQLTKDASNIARIAMKAKRGHDRPAKKMSEAELKSRIDRLRLEKDFETLSAEDVSRGKVTADDILSVIGSVVQIGGTLYLIYKAGK